MAAIMGLLIVSFAVWGIGDIFRGFGRSAVAKIGGTEITVDQFRIYYTDRINQIGRRLGRPITPDQVRALGLDRQVIGQLVAETALDERARQLGLGIADAEIARRITTDPTFRGLSGQFERGRFEQMIREAGFTEARFVTDQRQVTLRRQIALSITGELKPPLAALAAFNRYQNEKRNADLLALGPAQAGEIPKPEPEALKKYFDDRKILFRAPETRKLALLALTPAEQARWNEVSDADAKTYYEQRKSEYGTPERRHLRQIVFPSADEAKAASERIGKGLSFADLAKERALKDNDIDLGLVARANVIDPAVGEAAFALKDGEVSTPVQGRFGHVLVQVAKIEPAQQRSYEEVAAPIKRAIAETRARTEIGSLRDKIEDERAGGANLAEAAKKLGLTARIIEAIDRSGRGPDGVPVPNLPPSVDVIASAFTSGVGVENDPLQLPGGGYLWYEVAGIAPARDRTLDEVKDKLEARWRDDEIAARLKIMADEMVGKLKSGGTLAQLAAAAGTKIETVSDLQRGQANAKVPAKVLDAIFRSAKGAPATAEGETPAARVVFVVTEVVEPKLDPSSPEAKKLEDALRRGYDEDLIGEYVARLESELGVSINQSALDQVVGGGTAN